MNGNASNSDEGILIEVKDLLNQTISCGTRDAGKLFSFLLHSFFD